MVTPTFKISLLVVSVVDFNQSKGAGNPKAGYIIEAHQFLAKDSL